MALFVRLFERAELERDSDVRDPAVALLLGDCGTLFPFSSVSSMVLISCTLILNFPRIPGLAVHGISTYGVSDFINVHSATTISVFYFFIFIFISFRNFEEEREEGVRMGMGMGVGNY